MTDFPATEKQMTRREQQDLVTLVKKRERVMKAKATQRAAELAADFEKQLGTIYSYDQDETWKAAHEAAQKAVAQAEAQIKARCEELGIPARLAPGIHCSWYGRGENAASTRRSELRKIALSRIAALEKDAKAQIEVISLEAQTELLGGGLDSLAAKAFLNKLESVERLMPRLDAEQIRDASHSRLKRILADVD